MRVYSVAVLVLTHLLTHSLTHSLTYSLTHLLTHSLTHSCVTGSPNFEDDIGRQSTLLLPTSALDEDKYNMDEESEYLENYEMYAGRDSARILGSTLTHSLTHLLTHLLTT